MQNKKMKKKILASLIPALIAAQAAYAEELAPVLVTDTAEQQDSNQINKQQIDEHSASATDLVDIIADSPSVSVNQAGGVSGFPVIRGIADNRLNVQVDGMQLVASCPNHMNTPLSYVSPAQAETVEIYPGITPVSVGGDSIGGAILVKTSDPVFAPKGEQITQGEFGAYYRSNGVANGQSFSIMTASDKLNLSYDGSIAQSKNYSAAEDFKTTGTTTNAAAGTEFTSGTEGTTSGLDEVAGTAYKVINHNFSAAYKMDEDSVLKATVSKQVAPYEQYPNQRMDMTDNQSTKINLQYDRSMSWGAVHLQVYHEEVDHEMAFMDYKIQTQMPMDTESETDGFKLSSDIFLTDSSSLALGAEIQQFTLDDYWDPNPASAGMSPNTFWNINNGTRDRYALFAEYEQQLNSAWKTRIGARFEQVQMDADQVQGYHDSDTFVKPNGQTVVTNELTQADAFNAADRSQTDNNLNLTALASYKHSDRLDIDFGLARQVRSPTLYERYTWSTWSMAAVMNNFNGDGNGYYGDINLTPETAYTLSSNFDWHSADNKQWGLQVMPYFSYVEDYIDAVAVNYAADVYNVLQYKNQTARIYGVDIAGHMHLGNDQATGDWSAKAKLNYARGINTETNDNLYNIMPLNATITIMQKLNRWNNALEVVMVDSKDDVSMLRNELTTAAYSLVNLKFSYTLKAVRFDFGIENVFDRAYNLPTGGAYTGEGKTMAINGIDMLTVPGAGRSLYMGVNLKF
ncbi:TonB-dependent receptor plug domain-containing protein [Thiomicrorhabdus sp. 6S2-11]|uniref:TonB-dependent receptor plug domain-containing protein n=1 Tax=Thiomicrorhabdus marina TaxID=2818442 RepID=A0ABS3Q1N9_9GAMM|nr:TonB-dependent receptor [Thiomicrorhabdus marina]MBO1926233.1 TonB-dependent receptor plug domain-containing protein [Thiomicrorhabdus marina]